MGARQDKVKILSVGSCGGSRSRVFSITGDYMENELFCVYILKALRK